MERAAFLLDTVLAGADGWEVLHRAELNSSVLQAGGCRHGQGGVPTRSDGRLPDRAHHQPARTRISPGQYTNSKQSENLVEFSVLNCAATLIIFVKSWKLTAICTVDWQDSYNERARGLGATPAVPLGSSAEENLLCLAGDRYRGEDITVHEFAHSVHLLGLNAVSERQQHSRHCSQPQVFPTFDTELRSLYRAAKRTAVWGNHYAMVRH